MGNAIFVLILSLSLSRSLPVCELNSEQKALEAQKEKNPLSLCLGLYVCEPIRDLHVRYKITYSPLMATWSFHPSSLVRTRVKAKNLLGKRTSITRSNES